MKTYKIPLEEIKTLADETNSLQTWLVISNTIKNKATVDGDYVILAEQDYLDVIQSFLLGAVSKCPTILKICAQEEILSKPAVVSEVKRTSKCVEIPETVFAELINAVVGIDGYFENLNSKTAIFSFISLADNGNISVEIKGLLEYLRYLNHIIDNHISPISQSTLKVLLNSIPELREFKGFAMLFDRLEKNMAYDREIEEERKAKVKKQEELKDSDTDFHVAIQTDDVKAFDEFYAIELDKLDVILELVKNVKNTSESLMSAFLKDTCIVSNSQYMLLDCKAIVHWFDTYLGTALLSVPDTYWYFKYLGEAFHKYSTLKQSKVLQHLMSTIINVITENE